MLLFRDVFVGPVVRREKTVTRRSKPEWKERQFKVGSIHQAYVTPPWTKGKPFARLRIVSVTRSTFAAMWADIDECAREGFITPEAFHAYLRQHHGALDASQFNRIKLEPLARIEFELVQFDSKIAASFIDRARRQT